ncbi:MAG TPA: hypothetical protein DHV62_04625 [Elusimicrobia bacterium]|jgi:hypothetical protein|nr:hypothetical protein [Elusimicrobiota bacterium]
MVKSILVFLSVSFVSSVLLAAHPLTTDDLGTVDIGKYELEVGYDNCNGEDVLRNHSCGLSLKHGVTEKMDIGVSFPYQIKPKPAERFGTATVGFKFLLIRDIFAFSVNNELGSKEYFINGIFSRKISPLVFHFNFGYEASGDEDVKGKIIYSSAVEYQLAKIDLVGEVIGEKIGLQSWLLGVRYKLVNIYSLNFAYGSGFRNSEEKISFGFHTEF